MVIDSRYSADVSLCSIPTWLFQSPDAELPTVPILLSATNPESHHLSLHSYRLHAQRLATGLRWHGIKQGDRIVVTSWNHVAYAPLLMGVLMAGGIFTGTSPLISPEQLAGQLKELDVSMLIASDEAIPTAVQAIKQAGIDLDRVVSFNGDALFEGPVSSVKTRDNTSAAQGYRSWTEFLVDPSEGRKFDWREPSCCNEADANNQLAGILYSSGTTGTIKGSMISHRNYVANCTQWMAMQELDPNERQISEDSVFLGFLPFFNNFGQTQCLMITPKRGIRDYIMDKIDIEEIAMNIDRFKVNQLMGSPPIVLGLTKGSLAKKYSLQSLNRADIGGSPMGEELTKLFLDRLPNKSTVVRQGWGMTEITCIALGPHPLDKTPSIDAFVGELLPNCSGKVMSIKSSNQELGVNQIGEVFIKAPNVAKGYWKKPDLTHQILPGEGWLKTGDVGYYNEKGHWYILDRLSELIHLNDTDYVIPAKMQARLYDIPNVLDAAIVGFETSDGAVKPRAYVVLDDVSHPEKTKLDVLHAYNVSAPTNEQLPPDTGVVVIDAIPKLPGGKIFRKKLREMASQGASV